jgi:hypothetical protein
MVTVMTCIALADNTIDATSAYIGMITASSNLSGEGIAPPGQEGRLRDQVKIAKPPYFAQTGWWIQRSFS